MVFAIVWPWSGPTLSVRRIRRSSVPCSRSTFWRPFSSVDTLGEATARTPRMSRRAARQCVVELPDPVGEARGSGLEDVRGLDLEDAVVAHGGDAVPAGTLLNRRLPHLLATPRREHDLRISPRNFGGIDDPVFRERRIGELWKDGRPARNLDEL